MRCLLILFCLSQFVNAKPFGAGTDLPDYAMDPSWMQGAGIVTTLGSARMNADALPDVIGVSHAEDRVFWIDMTTSTPVWHLVTDDVRGPATLCAIDVDYDNDMDLIISSRWDRRLLLFLNQGDGSFVAGTDVASGIDTAVALFATDIDGDGRDDLVGISDFDREVFWLKHYVDGSFGSKQQIASTSGWPTQLEIIDFDDNGAPDIAVLDSGPGAVVVLGNNGTGHFMQTARLGTGLSSFTAAVFEGTRPDVIALSATLGGCVGYRNDDAGGFDPALTLASGLNGHQIAAQGDLDHDGDRDLLLNDYAGNQILWMNNRGGLVFDSPAAAALSPAGPTLSLLTDTDGDSDPELIQGSLPGSELMQYQGFGANPYSAWLDDYGLTSDIHPPEDDANGNGGNNLTAYAYNLSPVAEGEWHHLVLETGTSGLPSGVFHDVSSDLGIEFIRRRGSASGLTYSAASSTNLFDWISVDLDAAAISVIDPDWERVRIMLPPSSDPCGFLRLRVDYN